MFIRVYFCSSTSALICSNVAMMSALPTSMISGTEPLNHSQPSIVKNHVSAHTHICSILEPPSGFHVLAHAIKQEPPRTVICVLTDTPSRMPKYGGVYSICACSALTGPTITASQKICTMPVRNVAASLPMYVVAPPKRVAYISNEGAYVTPERHAALNCISSVSNAVPTGRMRE
jgi:hypothetical protein